MRAENPKEHVEQHSSGAHVCKHCGGEVAEDGYSAGGLIMDGESDEMGDVPEQYQATERMRDAAFAEALSEGGMVEGYSEGGRVFDARPDELEPDGRTLNKRGMRRRLDEHAANRPLTEEEQASMARPEYNQDTQAQRNKFSDDWYAAKKKREARGGSGPVGSTR